MRRGYNFRRHAYGIQAHVRAAATRELICILIHVDNLF